MTLRSTEASKVQLWGGVECTVNRVHDRYFHQMQRSGHWTRLSDLERIAALGIKKLRYPVLWELVAPDPDLTKADWSWPDERLPRLAELGVSPIVGLVHHGSGPPHTNLLDAGFAPGVAAFARACAQRYPWIEDYTPINEPLTTARFSALYGVWYPHARDYASMARALVNECRATVLAMREIRAVNPRARLVQTEDLGTITSTPKLAYQAAFENDRRWLSLDLLCGRLDDRHPLYSLMRQAVSDEELGFFLDNPCPPDIVGINYYITSDRYLDHHLEKYPPHLHGGNGRDAYADVEAVRAPAGIVGHEGTLRAAWERYGLPLAITEVHLDCHREDQLRWLAEAWQAATNLARDGVDVRGVTSWSLLGAYDWNSLCSQDNGYYESGAFDLRSSPPRATAIARAASALATTGSYEHPVLSRPGWWRRPQRLLHGTEDGTQQEPYSAAVEDGSSRRRTGGGRSPSLCPQPQRRTGNLQVVRDEPSRGAPIVITGATGTLGQAFARACEARALDHVLVSRREMDITDPAAVEAALTAMRPWAIINAAGYVRVDDAEQDRERCFRDNAVGPQVLAQAAARRGLPLVTFSSDLVFPGRGQPYDESDEPSPLSVYGQSKHEAEKLVMAAHPGALVIRTSAFFGPADPHNFITQALRQWRQGQPVVAPSDAVVSPTYVPDLVRVTLDLLVDAEAGVWHLANDGAITWYEAVVAAARAFGFDPKLVEARPLQDFRFPAPRPLGSALTSRRGRLMPPFHDALARMVEELDVEGTSSNDSQRYQEAMP